MSMRTSLRSGLIEEESSSQSTMQQKEMKKLRDGTHLSRDKLVIGGDTISVGPDSNLDISLVKKHLDVRSTCEQTDGEKTVFLGSSFSLQ